jgi:hypothetical protein
LDYIELSTYDEKTADTPLDKDLALAGIANEDAVVAGGLWRRRSGEIVAERKTGR